MNKQEAEVYLRLKCELIYLCVIILGALTMWLFYAAVPQGSIAFHAFRIFWWLSMCFNGWLLFWKMKACESFKDLLMCLFGMVMGPVTWITILLIRHQVLKFHKQYPEGESVENG